MPSENHSNDRCRQIIESILVEYTKIPYAHGDIQTEAVFDRTRDRYLLVNTGWDQGRRVHGCLVHVDVIDGKFWIYARRHGTRDRQGAGGRESAKGTNCLGIQAPGNPPAYRLCVRVALDGGSSIPRFLLPPHHRRTLAAAYGGDIDRHLHGVSSSAQDDALDRADVVVVAAPGEGDVLVEGSWLLVGSRSIQPKPGQKTETQACEASAPVKRERSGGGSVRR